MSTDVNTKEPETVRLTTVMGMSMGMGIHSCNPAIPILMDEIANTEQHAPEGDNNG